MATANYRGRSRVRPRGRSESGAVTAEFAVALPALILVLSFALALVSIALSNAALQSAARTGARVAIVESDPAVIWARAQEVAPAGASVTVDFSERWATVTVTKTPNIGPFALGPVRLSQSATALREQTDQW